VGAVSVHLEVGLDPGYTYRPGPPFLYEGAVAVSVHLDDAKGLLDDIALNGSPDELDRLADALHRAAATGRAEQDRQDPRTWAGEPDSEVDEDGSNRGAG